MAFSASSVQAGAAFGATLFPLIGPFGVTGMRQLVSAVALLAIARPPLLRLGLRRLLPAVLLGVVLVGMNFTLYSAVQRIGLGLGVTVEFLGPLGVALLGARGGGARAAAARAGCGALALIGVVLITDPLTGARVDVIGLAFGAAAAILWAAYILLSERAGALPGVTGTAVAGLTGTVLTLPVLVLLLLAVPREALPHVLLIGAITGVLSSALPYSIDLIVLRRMPRSLFGMLQSLHPVAAAVFGLVVLHQLLGPVQVGGIAAVCAANVLAVLVARRAR
ncbi:inner membrane transporter RhtA [Amnibacterium kyonggiense]|uniref:Inner membrane transporter RhtA n=1 Tax=Amnibacterium kyonggiense TaxID=595671 RepID=A0A4R7FLU4_9MICO|nr:inner membrane transporter RhtA [Amnibacterium kyonggiense]